MSARKKRLIFIPTFKFIYAKYIKMYIYVFSCYFADAGMIIIMSVCAYMVLYLIVRRVGNARGAVKSNDFYQITQINR